MHIGVFIETKTVDQMVTRVTKLHEQGFPSIWAPQIFGYDALTALAVTAREVPDIALGTAVIPTYPRHPMMLAAQARTVAQISGGRLTLGIGLSHQIVIEGILGLSYDKPVAHLRDYLSVLDPLLAGEPADVTGEHYSAHLGLDIPDSTPVPLIVAALGVRMLDLAGRRTDGTATWMTGPTTIADHIAPRLRAAAAEAGRPAPRIVSALPVAVVDDPDAARAEAAELFAMYGILPSYRAMLDREGAAGPADVAIVGDEDTVRAGIEAMFAAGTTEFVAVPFAAQPRTLELLATLL